MNEFEFTAGSLEAQGLQEGDEVECTYSDDNDFTEGCTYPVVKHTGRKLAIASNNDYPCRFCAGVNIKPVSVTAQQQLPPQIAPKKGYDPDVDANVDQHDSWGIGKSYTVPKKEWQPDTMNESADFKDALEYLDTFGILAEVTDKGMYIEGELTKVQWLDFAKILLEGEE